jgi:RNase P subunit RPR2
MAEPYIDTMYCELDDEKTQQVIAHIERTWRLGACRNCDGTFYQLLAQVTLRFSGRTDVVIDSRAYERPSAAIACTTCGEIRVVDLTVAGVYERNPPKPRPGREPAPRTGPYR